MPSSLSLIRAAYTEPARRGRAIAAWTMAGSVAAAGPVAGGALNPGRSENRRQRTGGSAGGA
ncbi:MAG TPA: hypothetical protein VGP05_18575, partial [Pseudonocardia sp.]|nr:hypothetical protein [Pseudonocardia sp.]